MKRCRFFITGIFLLGSVLAFGQQPLPNSTNTGQDVVRRTDNTESTPVVQSRTELRISLDEMPQLNRQPNESKDGFLKRLETNLASLRNLNEVAFVTFLEEENLILVSYFGQIEKSNFIASTEKVITPAQPQRSPMLPETSSSDKEEVLDESTIELRSKHEIALKELEEKQRLEKELRLNRSESKNLNTKSK